MVFSFQRALRRLRGWVRRNRAGVGHAAKVDGWTCVAWRGWDAGQRCVVEALRIVTRSRDEAMRLGQAYWGTDFLSPELGTQESGAAVVYWMAVTEPERVGRGRPDDVLVLVSGGRGTGPQAPAAMRWHAQRDLSATICRERIVLELAGTVYERVDD